MDPFTPQFNASSNASSTAGLQSFASTVPSYFDTSGITKATSDLNSNIMSTGSQAASSAGRQYSQTQRAQGGDPSLGGVAAAQALLPTFGQTSQNTLDLNKQKMQASEAQGSLAGQVASTMADLKTKYLTSLMGYTGGLQESQSRSQTAAQQLAEASKEFGVTSSQREQQIGQTGEQIGIQQQLADIQGKSQASSQKLGALQLLSQVPQQTFIPGSSSTGTDFNFTNPGVTINNSPQLNALRSSLYGLI